MTSVAWHIQGQIESCVCVWVWMFAMSMCVSVRVCVRTWVISYKHPFTLLLKLFRSYLCWSQGSVKSKPCRFTWRPSRSVHARPLPSSALLSLICWTWNLLAFPLFTFSWRLSKSLRRRTLKSDSWGWWEEGSAVSFSALTPQTDGWTEGEHVQSVASVFVALVHCRLPKAFVRGMLCTKCFFFFFFLSCSF